MKKIIAFCVAGLITLSADAAILRLDFSGFVGNVTTSSGLPPIRETDILADIQGDPVSGSYLIDTSAALLIAFNPTLGNAVYRTFESNGASSTGPSFITASNFNLGGMTFSSGDITPFQITSQVGVADDPAIDAYTINHQSVVSNGELYALGTNVQAGFGSGNTNLTNGLGLDQPFSGAFLGGSGLNSFSYILQSTGINLSLNYTLTDIQISEVSAVPLPAAAWLFGSGLIGLSAMARKKTTT